ncbi:hypothetical protein VNO77_41672 [Canavalia gladiata]|uniref:Uncharacterized protein n=1 Tax=Canavalia gladiata TaxID=3824 RepID=A0AAN9K088_CANGL
MAGGGFTNAGGGGDFEAKITPIVIISCIMAATGGLMFGYDVGVSGRASVPFRDCTFKNTWSIEYTVPAQCHHWHSIRQSSQLWHQQVVIAIILGIKLKDHSGELPKSFAVLVVVMVCTFVSSFAWSWGPLGWIVNATAQRCVKKQQEGDHAALNKESTSTD